MATSISWTNGDGSPSIDPTGTYNAVGFFGLGGFGTSVKIGEYQDTTFVVESDGSSQNGALSNNKFVDASGVSVAGGGREDLDAMTVEETTLRIHFFNTEAVQLQNTSFRAFDRSSINNAPSGVTVKAFEASTTASGVLAPVDASGVNSNGDTIWTEIAGATDLALIEHTFVDTDHYHYIGLSVSPDSIGQKTDLGFYYETEYL